MKDSERKRRAQEDALMVKRAVAGDQAAYKALIKRYKIPISQIVYRIIRDKREVEDLTQEVFIKAFQHLPDFKYDNQFASWLFKIANNHCLDHIRKKKLHIYSIHEMQFSNEDESEFEIPDSTYEPDLQMLREQKSKLIKNAINSLPEKYRKVIILRHHEEMSYEEIAREMKLPVNTIKVHLYRAREMLYKYLKDRIKNY
ncbi:MAG: RNA polymerase sigma factor [Candidatus Kryptoniota bacterium]